MDIPAGGAAAGAAAVMVATRARTLCICWGCMAKLVLKLIWQKAREVAKEDREGDELGDVMMEAEAC